RPSTCSAPSTPRPAPPRPRSRSKPGCRCSACARSSARSARSCAPPFRRTAMLETGHLTADQLAWYVTDGLDAGAPVDRDRLVQLDAHIAACERCARRLTDEARLELALTEVAARPSVPSRAS